MKTDRKCICTHTTKYNDLFEIDRKHVSDQADVTEIQNVECIAQEQNEKFVPETLTDVQAVSDQLKKNKFPLFSSPPAMGQT